MMEMLEAIGVFLLLSVILKSSENPVLTNCFLLFIGQISYEFYIIHFMLLMGILPFVSNVAIYIFITFCGSLLLAFIMQRSIKRIINGLNSVFYRL